MRGSGKDLDIQKLDRLVIVIEEEGTGEKKDVIRGGCEEDLKLSGGCLLKERDSFDPLRLLRVAVGGTRGIVKCEIKFPSLSAVREGKVDEPRGGEGDQEGSGIAGHSFRQ